MLGINVVSYYCFSFQPSWGVLANTKLLIELSCVVSHGFIISWFLTLVPRSSYMLRSIKKNEFSSFSS